MVVWIRSLAVFAAILLAFQSAHAQRLFIFQFLPVSAGQSIDPDDAACLRDIAFESV